MRLRLTVRLLWLLLAPLTAIERPARSAPEVIFVVNTIADVKDGAVGDGVCETALGNNICTLRAAIQEARIGAGAHTIQVPAGTYVLSQAGDDSVGQVGDLDAGGLTTIAGAGPESTIIDSGAINDRVFQIVSGTVTIQSVTIQNGTSDGPGGGVYVSAGTLVLSNTVLTRNAAVFGGGIYNQGHLILAGNTVYSNTATSEAITAYGGGIASFFGKADIVDSRVHGNLTDGQGGGLFVYASDVAITGTTFHDNYARVGGGIYYASSPDRSLVNSTLSANRASEAGGGLFVESFSDVALYNVTVTGNRANTEVDGKFGGGGIAMMPTTTVTLLHSLIAGNFAVDWSGPTLVPSDCDGNLSSASPNFVGVVAPPCAVSGVAPLTGSALLGPLANNGGPTPTHALLAGSPALDAGAIGGCTDSLGAPLAHDQRGAPRPAFGGTDFRCDLGAYERQVLALLPVIAR